MRRPPAIVLSSEEKAELKHWAIDASNPSRGRRAQIILAAAAGKSNQKVAAELKTTAHRVGRWRRHFAIGRLDSIWTIGPGRGRNKSTKREAAEEEVIFYNEDVSPPRGGKWTPSGLARALGLDKAMGHRVLDEAGIRLPSMLFTPKQYLRIENRVVDIVGIRCIPGYCALALLVKAGPCTPPTRNNLHTLWTRLHWTGPKEALIEDFDAKRWVRFAAFLDSGMKDGYRVFILDTYNSRKHPKVKAWLEKHPRVEWHYVRNLPWWLEITRLVFSYLHRYGKKKTELKKLLAAIGKQAGASSAGLSFEWKSKYRGPKVSESLSTRLPGEWRE